MLFNPYRETILRSKVPDNDFTVVTVAIALSKKGPCDRQSSETLSSITKPGDSITDERVG